MKIKVSEVLGTFILGTVMSMALTSCNGEKGYEAAKMSGVVWGTTYHIIYDGAKGGSQSEVSASVTAAMASVDSVANAFNPQSEIAVLNTDGRLVAPSPGFLMLLNASRTLNAETSGCFDPTVGPAVDFWGFGPSDAPSQSSPDSLKQLIGMEKIITTGDTVSFLVPDMELDFAAIAKGYGVDCVSRALRKCGIKDFMVEIGGEVCVSGVSPRGTAWSIQLDAPVPDVTGSHSRLAVLKVKDVSIATSGNYRNFREDADGRLIYHTISPVTACPADTDILSATVFAGDAMTADALATACMVMGLERASSLIESLAKREDGTKVYGAIFVTDGGDGDFDIHPVALSGDRIEI